MIEQDVLRTAVATLEAVGEPTHEDLHPNREIYSVVERAGIIHALLMNIAQFQTWLDALHGQQDELTVELRALLDRRICEACSIMMSLQPVN